MQSKAATVDAYLAELPADRREAILTVRDCVLKNLDSKYEEGMSYGMIGYYVPHSVYPAGYHCDPRQPLPFANLASQKNYMSLYLMSIYDEASAESFRAAWAKTGKKLDMGKCCIRFKRLEDLALDVIGAAIKSMPVDKFVRQYEALLGESRDATRPAAKKPAAKKRASAAGKKAAKPSAARQQGAKKAGRKASKKATKKQAASRARRS